MISIVVVAYQMGREAPRTLHSLSPQYQQDVRPDDYEVIVVDNGSNPPLGPEIVAEAGPNFRYVEVSDPKPSPIAAINDAVASAQGDAVGILIDGARLVTPGVIKHAAAAFRAFDDPVVAVPGFYLGPHTQRTAARRGYDQKVEDQYLESIDWPADGYRLFEIAYPDETWPRGFLATQTVAEANAIFLRRDTYEKIGGFDERFVSPGGGAANIEFFARSTTAPGTQFVVLMSEGSFHQFHGGIATSRHPKELAEHRREWQEEYRKVVGHDWQHPSPTPVFMGGLARPELDYIAWSALMAPPRPAEGRRLRYPQRVRRYMDVLHERELEKGWSLHDAERELTRLRTDVSDMRRELVRLGRVAQSDKKLLAAISRRLDGAQAQADPASTDERLRRYARGLRRRVRAYTNTKGSAERVQRGNGETKTSGIDVRYRRSEAPAHTAEDVAAG